VFLQISIGGLMQCDRTARTSGLHYDAFMPSSPAWQRFIDSTIMADEAFDWAHRPFFLRCNPENAAERVDHLKAFSELCEKLNVDPASV